MKQGNHIRTGREGEALATVYLQQNGFTILHCNWRYKRCEIDIIAVRNDVLHFIEVKTRRTTTFGFPEESVTAKKLKTVMTGADAYQRQHPQWKRVQYDVLSITLLRNEPAEYFLLEDVYC